MQIFQTWTSVVPEVVQCGTYRKGSSRRRTFGLVDTSPDNLSNVNVLDRTASYVIAYELYAKIKKAKTQ